MHSVQIDIFFPFVVGLFCMIDSALIRCCLLYVVGRLPTGCYTNAMVHPGMSVYRYVWNCNLGTNFYLILCANLRGFFAC